MLSKKKTILIGIDGASWNNMDRLLEEGKLPTIQSLMEKGIKGTLKSTMPPFSPVAWSTFMTGKSPDKHGIFDWSILSVKGDSVRYVSSNDRKALSFWHYLNDEGYKVGVCNLPLTYPAEKVKGFFISGFDSPDKSKSKYYPEELFQELEKSFPIDKFKVPGYSKLNTKEDYLNFLSNYDEYCSLQTDIFLKCADDYETDVLVINYMINDHFNHRMKDDDMFLKGLEIADKNVKRLIEKYPDAEIVIFSDHGSLRTDFALNIYFWLEKEGLVVFDESKLSLTKINSMLAKLFAERLKNTGYLSKVVRRVLINLLKVMPFKIHDQVRNILHKYTGDTQYWPHTAINLEKSKVIFSSAGSNGLYINPDYKTDRNDKQTYLALCDEITEKLKKGLLNPETEKTLVEKVVRRDDIYAGKHLQRSPDLFIVLSEPCNMWIQDIVTGDKNQKPIFKKNSEINYYGRHIEDGIFILCGNKFNTRSYVNVLHIKDIAAITLFINNVPVPDDLDGIVEMDLFSKEILEQTKLQYQIATKSESKGIDIPDRKKEEEDKEVQRKLSEMGYM